MGLLAAGKMDRRIRLERDGPDIHDGHQNVPGPPIVLAKAWAQYLPGSGKKEFASGENTAEVTGRFRIYWRKALDPNAETGLNPKDRLRYPAQGGRLYEIQSAVEMGRREGIEIAVIGRAD